jgi:hypothetical protein
MLTHLKVQYALGAAIAALMLLYHFLTRVLPGMLAEVSSPNSSEDFPRWRSCSQ